VWRLHIRERRPRELSAPPPADCRIAGPVVDAATVLQRQSRLFRLDGEARAEDFLLFETASGARNRNGHMLARANSNAAALADGRHWRKWAAATRTRWVRWADISVAPRARSKEEFLDALRMGQGRVRGETGGIWN